MHFVQRHLALAPTRIQRKLETAHTIALRSRLVQDVFLQRKNCGKKKKACLWFYGLSDGSDYKVSSARLKNLPLRRCRRQNAPEGHALARPRRYRSRCRHTPLTGRGTRAPHMVCLWKKSFKNTSHDLINCRWHLT